MADKILLERQDVTDAIEAAIQTLRRWRNYPYSEQEIRDERATAITMTKLEEAAMWSLKMVRETKPVEE
jgi:hypothetical protein